MYIYISAQILDKDYSKRHVIDNFISLLVFRFVGLFYHGAAFLRAELETHSLLVPRPMFESRKKTGI